MESFRSIQSLLLTSANACQISAPRWVLAEPINKFNFPVLKYLPGVIFRYLPDAVRLDFFHHRSFLSVVPPLEGRVCIAE